jgi:small subunit ribosomal protein S6
MRRYETIFIIDPDLSDEDRTSLFEKINPLFAQLDGFLVATNEWGVQKLAYEIKKKVRGYYVLLDYCGAGPLVNEIERIFRIDDRVLKYMTLIIEQEVDVKRLKEELAQAKAQAEAQAKAQAEAQAKAQAEAQAKAKEEQAALLKESEFAEKIPDENEPVGLENETIDTESDEEE